MAEVLNYLNAQPLLTLFLLIGTGLLLGSIRIGGIELGGSGVLFTALLAGHLGLTVPAATGSIGLVLFVYCVGVGAGGRFFAALRRQGKELALLTLAVVGSGALLTILAGRLFDLAPGMAVGIFAGALTSTPALAAAMEGHSVGGEQVVVGYGVAYPLGVIGVVLFIQLLPRLLGRDLEAEPESAEAEAPRIERRLVEVTNPNLIGKPIAESAVQQLGGCQLPRISHGGRLEPVGSEDVFEEGMEVLLVGQPQAVEIATEMIGRKLDKPVVVNADDERARFVVTNRDMTGKTQRQLDLLKNHGVVITRISRMEFEFVPDPTTRLEPNDILTVVGTRESLQAFEKTVGHRAQAFSQTSLVSIAIGLSLGIVVGGLTFPLPGGAEFSLGLAGGPLLVALLLGHFGRMGGIVGHIPRPTRVLLQEMGLAFFLAHAGIRGGAGLVEAVASQGLALLGIGAVITLVPLLLGFLIAHFLLRLSLFQTLGGICGGMTSTPALGALTAKTSRQAPIVSYATVYPVAVVLMALLAKLLYAVLG